MRKHFSTILWERIVLIILVAILSGFIGWLIGNGNAEPAWDTEFPMVNAKVSWENTYYPGPWEAID